MSDAVVTVSGLQVRRGAREILCGVSFEVGRGEVVALMGASGSGKTTILRVIAGLERFESGTLEVGGVLLDKGAPGAKTLRALRQKVGLVFQFHCLFEHMSALENVALALVHVQRIPRASALARARELLQTLGVDHRAAALPRELSGGEAQRVAIARALAIDPPVLLMDEPTASLDHARRMELAAFARSLAGRDRSVLLTTHDEHFAEAVASRVLHVREGRIAPPTGIPHERPDSRPGE